MKWKKSLISSGIGLFSVVCLVAAADAALGPASNPELAQEQQAIIAQEEVFYRKVAETGIFDISEDETGRKYWSVETYGGLTAVLEHYVHGFSKISFRDDNSVTIKFRPEATTIDRVHAAKLAFSRISILNEVYVEIHDVGTAVTIREQIQELLNVTNAKSIYPEFTEVIFQQYFEMVEI